jgi:hypothetical protein
LWDERVKLAEDTGVGCSMCAYALQARLAEAAVFEEEAQSCKPRVLDVFAGTGAVNLGMESATSGMKTTHAACDQAGAQCSADIEVCPPVMCVQARHRLGTALTKLF